MLSLPFDVRHFTKAQNVLHNCLTPQKFCYIKCVNIYCILNIFSSNYWNFIEIRLDTRFDDNMG